MLQVKICVCVFSVRLVQHLNSLLLQMTNLIAWIRYTPGGDDSSGGEQPF